MVAARDDAPLRRDVGDHGRRHRHRGKHLGRGVRGQPHRRAVGRGRDLEQHRVLGAAGLGDLYRALHGASSPETTT